MVVARIYIFLGKIEEESVAVLLGELFREEVPKRCLREPNFVHDKKRWILRIRRNVRRD